MLFTGCFSDAERQNPLDPKSALYQDTGTISGSVTNYYPPLIGIPGAELKIIPGFQGVQTDYAGTFQIKRVPVGEYLLIATRLGYATDSTLIQVENGRVTSHDFQLDALPRFSEPEITSIHTSRWFPLPYNLYYCYFQVKVDDPDGDSDIQQVTIQCETVGLVDTLEYLPTTGFYQKLIDFYEAAPYNPAVLIGQPIYFKAQDKAGFTANSSAMYLTRIISKTPETISPTSLETVPANPQLTWEEMELLHTFSYQVEIFRTDVPLPTLVWSLENIASSLTSITVSDSLSAGMYYWTVTVVDEFSNWSRSKEAAFRIE